MNQTNKKFYLFSTCIAVKGYSRSIIYDLQRKVYEYIPNSLCDILDEFNGSTIEEVINYYGIENQDVVQDYFEFLLENEFIFYSAFNKEQFPELDITWKSPYQISNITIDISDATFLAIDEIYNQIENLGCGGISFRFYEIKQVTDYFDKIAKKFSTSSCRSIEFIMPFSNIIGEKYLNEICVINQRIFSFHIFSAAIDEVVVLEDAKVPIFYHIEKLSKNLKNSVDVSNFIVNREMFVESKNFNTFFNKKIHIDEFGNIKNSSNSEESFGVILTTSILDILENEKFQQFWKISKDEIKGCKDCEYRYMCVDSRIPVKLNNDEWEFTESCGYDPYQMEWHN